jgi:hypothetical protein
MKNDAGKDRWALLPIGPAREVVRVLMHGAKEYRDPEGPNYLKVDNGEERYYEALIRHLAAWWEDGERYDLESGLHHLAHVASNALILLHRFRHQERKAKESEE